MIKSFWIVDFDTIEKENREGKSSKIKEFKDYFEKLKRFKNVEIIINNPCLEFWFLLHFEATSKYFDNCENVRKALKKYLKGYEKTQYFFTKQDNDIYLKLKLNLNTAKANAKKLDNFDFENTKRGYSGMYRIIEELEILKL